MGCDSTEGAEKKCLVSISQERALATWFCSCSTLLSTGHALLMNNPNFSEGENLSLLSCVQNLVASEYLSRVTPHFCCFRRRHAFHFTSRPPEGETQKSGFFTEFFNKTWFAPTFRMEGGRNHNFLKWKESSVSPTC